MKEEKWMPQHDPSAGHALPGQKRIPQDAERESKAWQGLHRMHWQPQAGWVDESWEARQCCGVGPRSIQVEGLETCTPELRWTDGQWGEWVGAPDEAVQGNPGPWQTHTLGCGNTVPVCVLCSLTCLACCSLPHLSHLFITHSTRLFVLS